MKDRSNRIAAKIEEGNVTGTEEIHLLPNEKIVAIKVDTSFVAPVNMEFIIVKFEGSHYSMINSFSSNQSQSDSFTN